MFLVIEMKESMQKEIDKRYEEIFRNLYVNWKLKLKNVMAYIIKNGGIFYIQIQLI